MHYAWIYIWKCLSSILCQHLHSLILISFACHTQSEDNLAKWEQKFFFASLEWKKRLKGTRKWVWEEHLLSRTWYEFHNIERVEQMFSYEYANLRKLLFLLFLCVSWNIVSTSSSTSLILPLEPLLYDFSLLFHFFHSYTLLARTLKIHLGDTHSLSYLKHFMYTHRMLWNKFRAMWKHFVLSFKSSFTLYNQ